MIWRRLRQLLCRLGVDAACYRDGDELAEREARARTLLWRFETVVSDYLHSARREGGDD